MTAPKPKRAPTEREQFEAAMRKRWPKWDVGCYSRDSNGYVMTWIDGAWEGWQIARRGRAIKPISLQTPSANGCDAPKDSMESARVSGRRGRRGHCRVDRIDGSDHPR